MTDIFIDDILVYVNSEGEHDKHLKKVIQTFKSYGILINLDKCEFGKKRWTFLGHNLSAEEISPTEKKIEAIRNFRSPTNTQKAKSFLGLA